MADLPLVRHLGHGQAQVVVVRLADNDWNAQPGTSVRVEIMSNDVFDESYGESD